MKHKIKRYLAIIPAVFVLLLSCVPLLGAHAEEDYSSYHHDPAQFTNFEQIFSLENVQQTLSNNIQSFTDSDYYYYMVYKDQYDYQYYRDSYTFYVMYFSLSSDTPIIDNDENSVYCVSSFYSYTYYENSYDFSATFSNFSDSPNSDGYYYFLVYDKVRDQAFWQRSSSSTITPSRFPLVHLYLVDSNLSEFGGSSLSVDVRFRPGLSGSVDRMLDNGDGTKSMVSQMRMTVVNNSRFPIQYKMYIMKKNRSSFRGGNLGAQHVNEKYDDDPVFIYYSNEWVYSNNLNNSQDWYNGHTQKQNKSTEWHYVSAGGSTAVLFNYSQIKLVENEEYTCIVEAVRNDYDCASRMFVYHATSEAAYPEYKQIWGDDKVAVYQSDFTMIHYSDVKYDPNDTSNGVNPYGSYGDSLSYEWGYNAVDEGNGNVDYNSKNLFKDKNSWYNTQYNPNGIVVPGSYSSSGSSSFDNLSGTLSGYFNFVSSVLGYFPGPVVSVFSFGVTAIVIVAFFKWVFK